MAENESLNLDSRGAQRWNQVLQKAFEGETFESMVDPLLNKAIRIAAGGSEAIQEVWSYA